MSFAVVHSYCIPSVTDRTACNNKNLHLINKIISNNVILVIFLAQMKNLIQF